MGLEKWNQMLGRTSEYLLVSLKRGKICTGAYYIHMGPLLCGGPPAPFKKLFHKDIPLHSSQSL